MVSGREITRSKTVVVKIGRTSGPVVDKEVESVFLEEHRELIKDIVAMVNAATNNKEGWYVELDGKKIFATDTTIPKIWVRGLHP
jgi:hypothetical protein